MRLFILAVGDSRRASSRLRVWDHVEWLRSQGHTVRSDSVAPASYQKFSMRLLLRIVTKFPFWMYQFLRADAVAVQETVCLGMIVGLKKVLKRRRLLFDFSDPIDIIGSGWRNGLRQWGFRRMTCAADIICIENRAYLQDLCDTGAMLRQFYGPVNARRYAAARARVRSTAAIVGTVHIGWTGSPATIKLIEPLFPVLDDIAQTRDITLTLFGLSSLPYAFRNLRATATPWTETREFEVVPQFDLGLFALDASSLSSRRGGGKLFVYMAAGVPFIASDRGIARDLMRESGTGFAVADDAAWREAFLEAIDDSACRARFCESGMQFADRELSYERFRERVLHSLLCG